MKRYTFVRRYVFEKHVFQGKAKVSPIIHDIIVIAKDPYTAAYFAKSIGLQFVGMTIDKSTKPISHHITLN